MADTKTTALTAAATMAATDLFPVVVDPAGTPATQKATGTVVAAMVKAAIGSASATATGVVELATTAEALTGTDTARAVTPEGLKYVLDRQAEFLPLAIGDETTALTTGTAKVTWRAPFALTLVAVRASLTTASSSGVPTFDINEGGTTILSTKLTIDANEKSSTSAATAVVISDTAIADDAELTVDVDVAGTGAAGAKIILYFTRNP